MGEKYKNERMPIVTFVATAHNEPDYNRAFINSINNQICKEFKAIVWNNGPDTTIRKLYNGTIRYNIVYRCSNINTGNYGTANRQQAIQIATVYFLHLYLI